jgi:peroxiredoxin
MKRVLILAAVLLGFVLTAAAQHEYAPLREQKIRYRDWTYKNVRTDEEVNLRDYAKDKKIVLVFYLAAWCHSSQYQSPVTERLYEKYKDLGLGIIGVSLYSSIEDIQKELDAKKITFPVVAESTSKLDREESLHYRYRKETGDERKWGTPWNIFLTSSDVKKKGDVLVKNAFVANGELIEQEAERFIRDKLGLPVEAQIPIAAAKNEIEPCEEVINMELQKPNR